jgi:hypothetical protein
MKENNEEFCVYWSRIRMQGKSKFLIRHLVKFSFYLMVIPLIVFFSMDYLILKKSIEFTDIISTIIGITIGYSVGIISFFGIKWKNNENKFKLLINGSADKKLT